MGEGEVLMHRADVDDLARRLAALQVLHESLRGEEGALQVRVQDEVVVVFRHVPERGVLFHARVVDEDVDLAQGGDAAGNELVDRGDRAEVRADGHRAPACGLNLCLDRVRFFRMRVIVDDDVGAFLREADRDGGSDALAASRDECDFSGEFHIREILPFGGSCKRYALFAVMQGKVFGSVSI